MQLLRNARAVLLVLTSAGALLGAPTLAFGQAETGANCVPPEQLALSIVLDDSSSMASSDPQDLRVDGLSIALDVLPDGAVVSAGWFAEDHAEFFGPTQLDGNRDALREQVSVSSGGNDTDFNQAFTLGAQQLDGAPPSVDRKAFVLLTDGAHNVGEIVADAELVARDIPIYVVGLGLEDDDAAEVQRIATGGYFVADDQAALQAAFASLTNELLCRAAIGEKTVALAAGETDELLFSIGEDDGGWRSVISWAEGDFAVVAVRPDGSVLEDGALRPGESIDASSERRRVVLALEPAVGDWRLRVTALDDVVDAPSVALQVFDAGEGRAVRSVAVFTFDAAGLDLLFERHGLVMLLVLVAAALLVMGIALCALVRWQQARQPTPPW